MPVETSVIGESSSPDAARKWLSPGVAGIGVASFFADVGREIPTALLPALLTSFGAPAAALGLIEGVANGAAGIARLAGGPIADDPRRRRSAALGGYATTAILSALLGIASSTWQIAVLRLGAWTARGLRVPARNALLADLVPANVCGRAYGFERAMDNLGAIGGPLLALLLVGLIGTRNAILLSVIPGLLAAASVLFGIRQAPRLKERTSAPFKLTIRPMLRGELGRLFIDRIRCVRDRKFAATALGFVLGGIAIGCAETAQHAAVAALAPSAVRGSAFGVLAAVQSFGQLSASTVAGVLWTATSPTIAFGYLAACMLVGTITTLLSTSSADSTRSKLS
jgi:hypothetical protein